MSETVPQATPVDLVQAAREMIRAKGAPSNAENLNRAMLAIARGQDTTDFDSKLDAMANGDRASRGASGKGNGSNRRGANARGDVASADVAEVNRTGRAPANRPQPSTPGTTAATGGNEDRPPETARAGDSNRPVRVSNVEQDLPGTGLDLTGERTRPPGGGVPRVPGTQQGSGTQAYVQLPLQDRAPRGTAQATEAPSPDTVGTPEPGQTPGVSTRPDLKGMFFAPDGTPTEGTRQFTDSILGMGMRGAAMRGNPFSPRPGPGTSGPPAPRGPDATAYPMGGAQDGRIVQLPQLQGPPMPQVAGSVPGRIGSEVMPPPMPTPPQAALPSSFGPPMPRGNMNTAPPQGTIPLRPGGSQSIPMPGAGQPRLGVDPAGARERSQALINELIRRNNSAPPR